MSSTLVSRPLATLKGSGEPLQSVPLTDEELSNADCPEIVADHSQIDYQRVCQLTSLIVDTRNR